MKTQLTAKDFYKFAEEGITDSELQEWYHITPDMGQRILILELAKMRNIYFETEKPKELA